MNEHWVIYFLVFASAFLLFQTVRHLVRERAQRRRTSQKFSAIGGFEKNKGEVDLLKQRSTSIAEGSVFSGLQKNLIQSGTNISLQRFAIIVAVLTAVLYWPAMRLGQLTGLVASFCVSTVGLLLFVRSKRSRRLVKFGEQLPDVIDVIVRSLKAGHPLPVALSLVGREMPSPAGPEFLILFEEISYGREIRDALENLFERVGHPDLKFLIASIAIAQQTGGNLGEILSRLSRLIRIRFQMGRKIKALSAEGRAGAYVLTAVPLGIVGMVSLIRPEYYGEFWGHPTQNAWFVIGGILLLVGNLTIRKMVNFKV